MKHHILVTVQGGVAEVCEDTVPPGVVVEILDFDNMAVDEEGEMSRWASQLREYWTKEPQELESMQRWCPCRLKSETD